jgi:holo-ACP synthase
MSGTNGSGVDLAAMAAERERRSARRSELAARYGTTIVQLTMVVPGPLKDSRAIRTAALHGVALLDEALTLSGLRPIHREAWNSPAGPCTLWAVETVATTAKRITLRLEETYTLGRLWDFDVCDAQGTTIDRAAFGLGARSCLVCDGIAAVCAGRRLHPIEMVLTRFEYLLGRGISELGGEDGLPEHGRIQP